MKHAHPSPFGATVLPSPGGVHFALWAPTAPQVVLEHGPTPHPMLRNEEGWHHLTLPEAAPGDPYRFRLPDGLRIPDPASRYNPDDVHGPSVVIDPRQYDWQHDTWRGRPWEEAVIYELHVGCFTPEGTFSAAAKRLQDLASLGITAIELMPLADFPGQRNWGYDGVLQFAPDASYGTPDDLKALIDTAHGLGLMVLIDVVYNHFGPEGNYLHAACPPFFNPAHQTPWGAAIHYDGAQARTVRDFFVHNALYWVEEFRFDGLRMDAIHAIRDDSPTHIAVEVCHALRDGPGRERHVHVVLENDANQASLLARDAQGRPAAATAQWNDDLHHAVHVLATGETDGYYIDYTDDPVAQFGRALAQGFIYQGQPSPFRAGEARGEDASRLPLGAFVSYLQTHDQVGNRAFGERIHAIGDIALVRAAWACLLLSPHVPMLFMGDEFEASTPFLYFCDFGPELSRAVSEGRRAEFGRFKAFADEAARARIPDPNAASTFEASKLRWDEWDDPLHAAWRVQVGEMLALRQRRLAPLLAGQRGAGRFETTRDGLLRVEWTLADTTRGEDGARLHLLAHFGEGPVEGIGAPPGEVLYATAVDRDGSQNGLLRAARGGVFVTLQEPGLA
ncbi:malto-oligosyltrehalose trehalohydrolase [Variovorax defluvii]|uniref:Malto-oligosyltrehalose trehalohydrolase n=1 Tax=Variovorax defluvii TaxID=913761 RepID=A0ABP8I5E6_9BURK